MARASSRNPGLGAVAGFLGGLAASFVMDHFMSGVALATVGRKPDNSDPQRAKQTIAARKRHYREMGDPTGEVSDGLARLFLGRPLTKREQDLSAPIVHYVFGALMGAAYGAVAEKQPKVSRGKGVPFGLALWAAGDEFAVPALGLTRKPWELPIESHAAMFASHIIYGLVLETVRGKVRDLRI